MRGRAVRMRGAGGPEVLAIDAFEPPRPGPGEVLVEVAAAGLNRADCLQRRGLYPAPPGSPADIPGLELAGTVVELGAGTISAAVGQRVMAISGGGAMATHVVLHERVLVPVPDNLTLAQAAAIPEVFFTAFDALEQARFAVGDVVLVHAVGSGIGTAAIQLVRAGGGTSIGTSRNPAKLTRCADLGLDHGLATGAAEFADAARTASGGRGVDVVLDCVGAAYLDENLRALASRGRIVVIGLLGGASGPVSLGLLLGKRASVCGTVLRARPLEEKAALAQTISRRLVPMFARGALVPVIDEVLPMAQIAEAHARMERNETFGKLVLTW